MDYYVVEILHYILPLIGVIVGFILSTIKEIIFSHIQNKPKVKLEMKWGQFNYFLNKIDNEGYPLSLDCFPEKSNCIKLDLIIDVYNYGKRSIAIKDFAIEVKAYKKSVCYFSPELNDYSNNQKIYSVNLPSNTINTLNMYLEIEKDETNTILFENSLSFDPENKNSLKFILHMTDIKNKKYKLKIDPLSIRTAF